MSVNLGLQSETVLEKESLKNVNQILHYIWESNDSAEFKVPVDWKALQLFDYLQIIKNPMDLGTVKKKLQADKYKTVEQVLEDIQLTWDNCKTYNQEGSVIWKQADKLEKLMRRAIKNFLPNIVMKLPQHKPQTQQNQEAVQDIDEIFYQNKVNLANKIKQLNQNQLQMIINVIKQEFPLSFKEYDKNKYMILFDSMTLDFINKLNQQTDDILNQLEINSKRIKISAL